MEPKGSKLLYNLLLSMPPHHETGTSSVFTFILANVM